MELYRTIMNHGFLIYEDSTKFVLHKTPTPISQMPRSGGENWEFNSFDEALEAVKKMIGWKDEVPADTQSTTTSWRMEMMYRHNGLGVKFADLGELGPTSFDNAMNEAKTRAEAYIVKSGLEKSITGFEVKVRPCQKRN